MADWRATRSTATRSEPLMRLETRVIRILPGPRPLTISTTRVEGLPPTECLNPAGSTIWTTACQLFRRAVFHRCAGRGRIFEYEAKVRQNKIGMVRHESSLEKHVYCFLVSCRHCFSFHQPRRTGRQLGCTGSLEQRSFEGAD